MATTSTINNKRSMLVKDVKTILVSQPKPARSPYFELEEKFSVSIDFRQFIHVEPVTEKEFRRTRIRPNEFSAIVFTSKNSIEHFFRMCEEMRVKMSGETKYFCLTQAIGNYLQKFIVYRKRKVFVGNRTISDLESYLIKHKANEKFLLPCSNLGSKEVSTFLGDHDFDFQEAMMYRTVSSDLSDLRDIKYDMLVFFSPLGIQSLFDNFPDFEQNDTRIAVYGTSTGLAVEEKGLRIDVQAPAPGLPSMTMALAKYLQENNVI